MAEESEHKSGYCAKHLILPSFVPSFDEVMCIQCKAELRTLKSLGLYWRTWPDEKPQLGDVVVIIANVSGALDCAIGWYLGANRFLPKGHHIHFKLQDGERWMPWKVLEVLP